MGTLGILPVPDLIVEAILMDSVAEKGSVWLPVRRGTVLQTTPGTDGRRGSPR